MAWRVTGQQETSGQDPHGMYTHGVRVSFITDKGATGSVFVPQHTYNVETVRQAIDARAAHMDDVAGLQG